jgi:hypothetical protein
MGEREYRLIHTPLLRVWLWRLERSRWKILAWRESEGETQIRGRTVVRDGRPGVGVCGSVAVTGTCTSAGGATACTERSRP